ncbi:MAG: hypothetical protein KatS3mg109_1161 [Pirellulaceae bacterium]|nr:MAG: hypothetical protein KatS3mg109_1161 [Pirellulaceae bacterium]
MPPPCKPWSFCLAEPEKDRLLISRNVRWLEEAQIKSGAFSGMWSYSGSAGRGDNSNTQFALLALYEASRVGVPVNETVWQLSLEHFRNSQADDGTWDYVQPKSRGSGSMTCAGVGSMLICMDRLAVHEASVDPNGRVVCCGQQVVEEPVEKAIAWLGRQTLQENPRGETWHYYYLYGIERVGRLSGRRFFGQLDWYRTGAKILVDQQDQLNGQWRRGNLLEGNPLLATSFALLFLAKGRRPVVIAQLDWQDTGDWNRHPGALHNLTQYVEQQWRRELSWQTIRLRQATVEDLLESPVLFVRGTEALQLTDQQKQMLQAYVAQGGFLLVEACIGDGCRGEAFEESFRQLASELFPASPLRELPPDHPIWDAEQVVDPRALPDGFWLYGIDACCRTSVVFMNRTMSCYWELGVGRGRERYPAQVRARVEAALQLGQNILAYATNRELRDRLDRPALRRDALQSVAVRGALAIAKLAHNGGADDAPQALANLVAVLEKELELRVHYDRQLLAPTDVQLADYPILFMHGRRDFRFTAAERQALATYIERGGFILADAICASPAFATAFRREFEAMFPESRFVTLPSDHALFTDRYRGALLERVTVRQPQPRGGARTRLVQQAPILEALEVDGRIAVVFSPLDISCALENQSSLECHGYTTADAARLATNVILFALGQ